MYFTGLSQLLFIIDHTHCWRNPHEHHCKKQYFIIFTCPWMCWWFSPGKQWSVESIQPNPACQVQHLIQAEALLSWSHTSRKVGVTGAIMLMSVFVEPKLSLHWNGFYTVCVCVRLTAQMRTGCRQLLCSGPHSVPSRCISPQPTCHP